MQVRKFDPYEFEKHIPHEMHFKEVHFPKSNEMYWVAKGIFQEADLKTFQDALKEYGGEMKKAYITSRHISGLNYHIDLAKERVAIVTKDEIISDGFVRAARADGYEVGEREL